MAQEASSSSSSSQLDLLKFNTIDFVDRASDTNKTIRAKESTYHEMQELVLNKSVPETLLILDTETTGLDFEHDQCLEIGAILFHVLSR